MLRLRLQPGTDRAAFIAALQLPAGVTAAEPGDAAERVSNLSRAYRVNLTVLALVALFTGAFLVFSILSLSVSRRLPQLALLGVLGLTAAQRRRLVLSECALLGAAAKAAKDPVAKAVLTRMTADESIHGQAGFHYLAVLLPVSGEYAAAGKVILDGVYNDVRDPEGFAVEAAQGAQMGFDGKTLVHPSQVEPCNSAFSPTAEEVEHSRRVIAAFDEGLAAGKGVITVDGRMIENLHVDNARRAIAIADAIAALTD